MSIGNSLTPVAHTRFEYLDAFYRPRVALLVKGERFIEWDNYIDEVGLKIASQRTHALALGLLIDFLVTHADEYTAGEPIKLRNWFRDFCSSLLEGTIRDGQCKYNLWWIGRTVRSVTNLQRDVAAFLEWIANNQGTKSVLPSRKSSVPEQLKFWARWRHKKTKSLLGHLKTRAQEIAASQTYNAVKISRNDVSTRGAPRRFPDQYFPELLNKGFVRRPSIAWTTYRDQLILLLLHGAGLRISDALNLWITDIFPDPDYSDSVDVRLYHPEEGVFHYRDPLSGNMVQITRANYLKQKYNRVPLRMEPGNRNVGSKDLLYMNPLEKFTLGFWRGLEYGRAFKRLFEKYMQSRPVIRTHPFLFVSSQGNPMTVKGFEKVHAAAIRRIGLLASKNLGTIPHGHRHSYIFCLDEAGIKAKQIQLAAHHKSETSQDAYKHPTAEEAKALIYKRVPSVASLLSNA